MSLKYLSVVFFGFIFLILACRRDEYYEGSDITLTFSEDTLRIDTVFTTIGSATRWLKVYNKNEQPVLVDIKLRNQSNSFFRINADGLKGPVVNNVEINGNDSIYIFVEVTVDPDQPISTSPFIIEDQVDVTVNGSTFTAHLEAFGQNANYITPSDGNGKGFLYSCDFGERIWDDPKPYIIYGILYVDSCKIILPAGTRLYVHGGIVRDTNTIYNDGLVVFLKNGSLETQGTLDAPVIIQGDRLEKEFQDVKSQWVGLMFWQESKQNILRHTIVKNSIIGVRVDSLADLKLYATQISNTSGPAIIGRHATVYGENCLFYDNASYGLQLTYGGNYHFNYCTVGSYEGQKEAVSIDDVQCGDIFCSLPNRRYNDLDATFTNCIFNGSDKDEVSIIRAGEGKVSFQYKFTNCAFRVADLLDPKNQPNFFDNCTDCINLKQNDRVFLDNRKDDYRLDTMSVVLNKGLALSIIMTDILDKMRKPTPDIGCYEF